MGASGLTALELILLTACSDPLAAVNEPAPIAHIGDYRCPPGQLAVDYYFTASDNGWLCYTPVL